MIFDEDKEYLNKDEFDDNENLSEEIWSDLDDVRELITLIDDEGNQIELCVIDAILHEGKNYLLCIESSEVDTDAETEAYIFKESENLENDSDNMSLMLVEDEDEYNSLIQLFQNDDYELN